MACTAVEQPLDWSSLAAGLAKKTTFEAAARQAAQQLAGRPAAVTDADARQLLARCRTLLRSRYSTRPFWLAGRQLFQAAQQAVRGSGDAALESQIVEYIAECNAFLGEGSSDSGSGSGSDPVQPSRGGISSTRGSSTGFLFEGQLSGQEAPPRPPGLLELLSGALPQQLAAALAQQQGHQGQQQQEEGREQQQQAGGQQQGQQLQAGGQQGQQQADGPPSTEVLEAIERELDAIAVQLMEETGQAAAAQRAAPPASKKVVASLPKEVLKQERLAALGGPGVRCPVCM